MKINITNVRQENISGEFNGYKYELLQVITKDRFAYKLISPEGKATIVELDSEAIQKLTEDPQTFWDRYVR